MEDNVVEPGKIVTIIFNSPFSKPLAVAISDNKHRDKLGIVYIAANSPLARAILNHNAGDKIEFRSPEGKLAINIINISS